MALNFNKELLESLKTNMLVIEIGDDDYNNINSIINELKIKYKNKLDYIQNNQEKNLYNINYHCDIIKNVIQDIINCFDVVNQFNICAFLIGSFARCSCKKNSDIDFQLAYPQKYKNNIFKYEEMIYYIISSVTGLKRKNVHSMLVSRLNRENINYINKILDDNDLIVKLHSNAGEIIYKYSANTKRRIYLQYGNNNSLENIFDYLKYEIDNNNKEWSHVFYVFSSNDDFNKRYDELYNYEKKLISNDRITKRKCRIKKKINEIKKMLNKINTKNISQVKLLYQKKEFALLNEYISFKRDIFLLKNIDWKYINYYENYQYLMDDEIFQKILNYMFFLFEIVEPLGTKFSLHTNACVELKEYKQLKKKMKMINDEIYFITKRKEI